MMSNNFMSTIFISPSFWGWGGEDDEFYRRLKKKGLEPTNLHTDQGMYRALSHSQAKANEDRFRVLKESQKRVNPVGLKECKYNVTNIIQTELFTHIKVIL